VWRYTIVGGGQPRERVLCLEPGFSTPGKGCTLTSKG